MRLSLISGMAELCRDFSGAQARSSGGNLFPQTTNPDNEQTAELAGRIPVI
jgi:hypothetical protein